MKSFAENVELNLNPIAIRNLYLIVFLGDFQAIRKGWYIQGKTT